MRVTPQPIYQLTVVAVGRNQWENVKPALHPYLHLFVVQMAKLSRLSLSQAQSSASAANQGASMRQLSLRPLSASPNI
jgi:hypothetical protein